MKTNPLFYLPFIALLGLISLPSLSAAESVLLQDQVIKNDAKWSGEIIVEGTVVVGRGATLFIEPGTLVRFKRIDRNCDGIGDGEIRVLGRLLAPGTSDKHIRFASAEPQPAGNDWSYVLIFSSGQESDFSYCEFQDAFTGLQIHFSTARVTNSLFQKNTEGMRFGRARLLIEHNEFKGNRIGIRFTRMEGPVTIRANRIIENETGMFLVPSGQNIMDFFTPDRSDRPWNTGRLLITANTIANNVGYNLNLGEKQLWDLEIIGNWWGDTEPLRIEERIFDQHRDPALGRALYQPFASGPGIGAGIEGEKNAAAR